MKRIVEESKVVEFVAFLIANRFQSGDLVSYQLPLLCILLFLFECCSLDDAKWPEPTRDAKQELEVVLGDQHISFSVRLIGSWSLIELLLSNGQIFGWHMATQTL